MANAEGGRIGTESIPDDVDEETYGEISPDDAAYDDRLEEAEADITLGRDEEPDV